jgi:hypothetical protein
VGLKHSFAINGINNGDKYSTSSRDVLSHYSKCKDPNCPVCAPVRDAIKKNDEQGKMIIKNTQGDGWIARLDDGSKGGRAVAKNFSQQQFWDHLNTTRFKIAAMARS